MATGMWQNAINNMNLPALGFGLGMMQAAQPSTKPANFGNDMQAGLKGAEGMSKLKGLLGKMGQGGDASAGDDGSQSFPPQMGGLNANGMNSISAATGMNGYANMMHGFMNNPWFQQYQKWMGNTGMQPQTFNPSNGGFSLGMTPKF